LKDLEKSSEDLRTQFEDYRNQVRWKIIKAVIISGSIGIAAGVLIGVFAE
jgi:hypothetical protein